MCQQDYGAKKSSVAGDLVRSVDKPVSNKIIGSETTRVICNRGPLYIGQRLENKFAN